jgi:hypothetical protein
MKAKLLALLLVSIVALLVFGSSVALAEEPLPPALRQMPPKWIQNIERATYNNTTLYSVDHIYHDQYSCDSEPDTDHVLVFYLDYQQNPDSLKLYHALVPVGTTFRGYALEWNECRVCMGDTWWTILGGESAVQANTKLFRE